MASDNKHNQLFAAIKKKDTERVRTLISNGATVNLPNKKFNGNTALHWAAKHSSTKIIGMILKKNPDINAVNDKGRTPLHVAIRYSQEKVKIVKFLLKRGADVNMKNRHGNTPLYCVILNTRKHKNPSIDATKVDTNVLSTILKYNPDVNAVNDKGLTALHRACIRGLDPVIKLLLEHNADVNCEDRKGWTPLFYAYKYCKANDAAGIKWLLEHKANTCHITKKGYTLLHYLARTDFGKTDNEMIRLLIDNDLDILTICDKRGRSAFHVINQVANNYYIVDLLVAYGADVYLLDNNNHDPIYYLLKTQITARKRMDKLEEQEIEREERMTSFIEDVKFLVGFEKYQNKLCFTLNARKIIRDYMIELAFIGLLWEKNYFTVFVSKNIVFHKDEAKYDECDAWQHAFICAEEIKRLKTQIIGKSNITLYDFLKQSAADAAKYANNMEIRQLLQSRHYDEEYPVYIGIVKYRFAEGVAWNKLLKTIPPYFISRIFNSLPDECVDMILSYLNFNEFKTFIGAIKPNISSY